MRRLESRLQRYPTRLPVTFWVPGRESDYRTGRITNISASGIFVSTAAPMAPPARIELRFILREVTHDVQGEVVRTLGQTKFVQRSDGSGMGVRFLDPQSASVKSLIGMRAGGLG